MVVLTQEELEDALRGYVAHKTGRPPGDIRIFTNYGKGDGQANVAHYGRISVEVDLKDNTNEGD